MKKDTIIPIQRESTFDLHELFFSTTDIHGKITGANQVFTRVSGYEWEQLHNQPHSIIRHPDMPRAVFKVLWDTIEAGSPIAAYVKNMAKDGSYYWVLALVCPIASGYLSVRLKPSTQLVGVVENLYRDVRNYERQQEFVDKGKAEAAKAGVTKILEGLRSLGFNSYQEFSEHILVAELNSRDASLGNGIVSDDALAINVSSRSPLLNIAGEVKTGLDVVFGEVATFFTLSERLGKSSSHIMNLATEIGLLSLNATVEAARLQDAGRTLAVIAQHIGSASISMKHTIRSVNGSMGQLSALLKRTAFELGSCKLYVEMVEFFLSNLTKTGASDVTSQNNVVLLFEVLRDTIARTHVTTSKLGDLLLEFEDQVQQLVKFIVGLRFVHVSGKVEVARLANAAAFDAIFSKAISQVHAAREELEAINHLASNVTIPTTSLLNMKEMLESASQNSAPN